MNFRQIGAKTVEIMSGLVPSTDNAGTDGDDARTDTLLGGIMTLKGNEYLIDIGSYNSISIGDTSIDKAGLYPMA